MPVTPHNGKERRKKESIPLFVPQWEIWGPFASYCEVPVLTINPLCCYSADELCSILYFTMIPTSFYPWSWSEISSGQSWWLEQSQPYMMSGWWDWIIRLKKWPMSNKLAHTHMCVKQKTFLWASPALHVSIVRDISIAMLRVHLHASFPLHSTAWLCLKPCLFVFLTNKSYR